MTVKERIGTGYLIPVVVIDDAARAVDTAKALLAGGVDIMEITLRTEAGLRAIEMVTRNCPDILVGGGTVLSPDKCREAVSRGAAFIVSPGFDPEIVEFCLKNKVAVYPGCVTPTEITAALKAGLETVKFFPANVYGGIQAIKALSGPFPQIKFIPTGGVDLGNLAEYMVPQVFAVGGGWLCDRKALNAGNYEAITRTCARSVELVKQAR
ncbi:MAG: bifunctional 4-hydroxy-2-oxoglutarate aldolase/2-dehydro-3-deoxy-phosphogluconate aldolase [Spirochaetaceae bacterium]|jgi:2-dehydro-3-deoxyphosphogluconate aldolase/(4S)-4-hydroxy-2-oxoglutarate aldolase|nr:bifunctional 4-hydroxy-2-oxoglutarate aldolase/2-dehydro-3-deoxy-phosphogluconate aldolase [Spirochaetaceae bacterium]